MAYTPNAPFIDDPGAVSQPTPAYDIPPGRRTLRAPELTQPESRTAAAQAKAEVGAASYGNPSAHWSWLAPRFRGFKEPARPAAPSGCRLRSSGFSKDPRSHVGKAVRFEGGAMKDPKPAKSLKKYQSLTDAQLDEAKKNTERCLEALDERGEEGLQDELNRIFPSTERPAKRKLVVEPIPLSRREGPRIEGVRLDNPANKGATSQEVLDALLEAVRRLHEGRP